MTQEEKDLLLKDLCTRLPYGLKVHYKTAGWEDKNCTLTPQVIDNFLIRKDVIVKPYLRPMSSMTEEEKKECQSLCEIHIEHDADDNVTYYYFDTVESFDWLNKNMFDFRGLIPKGLAIAVTEKK